MPFNIVKTFTKEGVELSTVPSFWVEDNILFWPTNSDSIKSLVRNEFSKPQTTWLRIPCEVVINGICTFKDAEIAMRYVHNAPDAGAITDAQPEAVIDSKGRKYFASFIDKEEIEQNLPENDTGSEQIASPDESQFKTSPHYYDEDPLLSTSQQHRQFIYSFPSDFSNLQNQSTATNGIENVVYMPTADDSLEAATSSTDPIINLTRRIQNLEKFVKILETNFNRMKSFCDELNRRLGGRLKFPITSHTPLNTDNFTFKTLENLKELKELEDKLENLSYKAWLIAYLSSYFGERSEGKSCAYKLVDMIFTRQLMLTCSLLGGSREHSVDNWGLKLHKKVYNLFFEIVHHVDPSFTLKKHDDFFALIIKNKKPRSSSEHAPKKLLTINSECDQRPTDCFNEMITCFGETSEFYFKTTETVAQLDELENKLNDLNFKEQLLNYFSGLYGSDGKSDGKSVAYRLVDHMFTRELMASCSLLGGSKDPDAVNNWGIRLYKNIYSLFFDVVHKSDATFTWQKQDEFFGVVVKNKKARFAAVLTNGGMLKISSRKRRPKNIVYQKKSKSSKPMEEMSDSSIAFETCDLNESNLSSDNDDASMNIT